MGVINVSGVDWTYDSVIDTGQVKFPAAEQTLASIGAGDLPSGYYKIWLNIGVVETDGGQPPETELGNMRLVIGTSNPVTLYSLGVQPNQFEMYRNLSGTEGITVRTEVAGGDVLYTVQLVATQLRAF